MISERDAYHEICAYTLTHGDLAFIHQHVVDTFAAQQATDQSKPIGVTFALVGLYLHVERNFTGRQVQRAHMQLARRKQWPTFILPANRGRLTAVDVLAASDRDAAIYEWCRAVWEAFSINRQTIIDLLARNDLAN
jgi:hypothetical protein